MTETARWLEERRRELSLRVTGAGVALALGAVLLALAGGVLLGRLGTYAWAPVLALVAWLATVGVGVWGLQRLNKSRRRMTVLALARRIEEEAGARRGLIVGPAAWEPSGGSVSLAAAADSHARAWLARKGEVALAGERRRVSRSLFTGGAVLAVGAVTLIASGPTAAHGATLWHPFRVLMARRGPVELSVDRRDVRRGERVTAFVRAPGRQAARLWVRAPGEPWSYGAVELDSAGMSSTVVGPLDSDRFLRAESGGRVSRTVHVEVSLPVFFTDFQLTARFPEYLHRPDESVPAAGDTVVLPVGTRLETHGRATVDIERAAWVNSDDSVALKVIGNTLSGSLVVRATNRWQMAVTTRGGGTLESAPPALTVLAVPDSAPVVAIAVPGADGVAPFSLRQPIVIDARDDHRLTKTELASWRVSRIGSRDEEVVEEIALPPEGTDRAVLHWTLDLTGRPFLPGDTVHYKARARDNAPEANWAESATFALRLPSTDELRRTVRAASRGVVARTDSLTEAQQELARAIEDLAAERDRRAAEAGGDQLPFNSAQQARELLNEQDAAWRRARELAEEVRELSEAAWSAGITDPEFHRQLEDLERLLESALSDELVERLESLREALAQLDAPAARDALERLADAARRLRDGLERSRELLQRAAIEGELTSLADDAEGLAQRQEEWTKQAERGVDSVLADWEEQLAARAETLAAELEALQAAIDSAGVQGEVSGAQRGAQRGASEMRQAGRRARAGDEQGARESGDRAARSLGPLAKQLREERELMRGEWRREVMAAMDRALVESSELASAQERVARRLARGESGEDVRGAQAAAREGIDRVLERLERAAGRNALVSPRLGAELGLARTRMNETLEQLQRPTPSTRQAGSRAGEALDALNSVIYSLLRSRSEVAGAESGSGLAEAIERMAELADQQGGLNSEAGNLLPMVPQGGEALMRRLEEVARGERQLAEALERLRAESGMTGADELAEHAREIARELEAGRLDSETIQRQEQLFRRLLDAGRTLRSDAQDEREERVSRTADPSNVRLPGTTDVPGDGPRFRYPSWEELRTLSPEDRKLILDYFRRLNAGRPRGRP
ncbi:MAG: hypothetical protein ACE5PT_01265 [Gemmatimonadales bacterium]